MRNQSAIEASAQIIIALGLVTPANYWMSWRSR